VTRQVGVIVPPDLGHRSQVCSRRQVQAEHIVRAVDDRRDQWRDEAAERSGKAPCVAVPIPRASSPVYFVLAKRAMMRESARWGSVACAVY
jgi:hypothetical protein